MGVGFAFGKSFFLPQTICRFANAALDIVAIDAVVLITRGHACRILALRWHGDIAATTSSQRSAKHAADPAGTNFC